MAKDFMYVNFDIPLEEHRQLKLLSIAKDCSIKSLLQEAIHSYVQSEDVQQYIKNLTAQPVTPAEPEKSQTGNISNISDEPALEAVEDSPQEFQTPFLSM